MVAPGVASVIDTLSVEEKLVPPAGVKMGAAAVESEASLAVPLKPQPFVRATRTKDSSARASTLWRYNRRFTSPHLRETTCLECYIPKASL